MRPRLLGPGFLMALLLGCGPRQRNEDFIPTPEVARNALDRYLTAWKNGEPGMRVAGSSPAIDGSDTLRSGGRTLEAFEVLGPVAADAPHCFAVRLTLGNPHEVVRERYVVFGLDPLQVMRYDDFEMVLHWSHAMPTAKK